jgi:LL-diaminopimelate aminotransferase
MYSLTSSSTLQITPSERLLRAKPYFFKAQDDLIQQLTSQGKKILRFDVGSPDMPPADHIIEEMIKFLKQPDQHGYSPHGGNMRFREAASEYYYHRFNVSLNPQKETVAVIGTKEGLFHFAQAFINENDVVLVPDPAYPVYLNSSLIAGAKVFTLPLLTENHFLPKLDDLPQDVLQRAKCLWLNYPNNPTGATASLDFFEKIVALCRKHGIFIIHDAAYNDVYLVKTIHHQVFCKYQMQKISPLNYIHSLKPTNGRLESSMAVGNEQAVGI